MRKRKKYLGDVLNVRVPAPLIRAVNIAADREGLDMSKWVRNVLSRAAVESIEQRAAAGAAE